MNPAPSEKLDYRCRGTGCGSTKTCRRYLVGPEAQKATAPFAALDLRERPGNVCAFYLERIRRAVD